MPRIPPFAIPQLSRGRLMGLIGAVLALLVGWLFADGWFEPKLHYGFNFSVTIDYQGREIELKRNVECVWSGGGRGEGAAGGGGGRVVAYHNFGQIMPDGALVMVMVPNLCRHVVDWKPNTRFVNGFGSHDPVWKLPPKDNEMPLLFWAAKPEGFDEVLGFYAPEAYSGPYAKFQIKSWDAHPLPWGRPRDFDPPDNYAAMGLVGPSDDRYKYRWNGKHRVGLPIDLSLIAFSIHPVVGMSYRMDTRYTSVMPGDPSLAFVNVTQYAKDPILGPEFRRTLEAARLKNLALSQADYGVRTNPGAQYRITQGFCLKDGKLIHGPHTLGVACFYNTGRFTHKDKLVFGYTHDQMRLAYPPIKADQRNDVGAIKDGIPYVEFGYDLNAAVGY